MDILTALLVKPYIDETIRQVNEFMMEKERENPGLIIITIKEEKE